MEGDQSHQPPLIPVDLQKQEYNTAIMCNNNNNFQFKVSNNKVTIAFQGFKSNKFPRLQAFDSIVDAKRKYTRVTIDR